MKNILLIGYGYAGKRFFKCLEYLKKDFDFNISGIIEKNKDIDFPQNVPVFVSIEDYFKKNIADVVVVATNDFTHELIFEKLKVRGNFDIISEKPLVTNIDFYNSLKKFFNSRKICINYVERFSPIVNDLKNFLRKKNIKIERGVFFWGKDRFFDSRPTQGVYADVTHPIDLLVYLFRFRYPSIRINNYTTFDFTISRKDVLDSIDLTLKDKGIYITGHSSFMWSGRKREILLYTHRIKNNNYRYKISLFFDHPHWDYDTIKITRVNTKTLEQKVIFEKKYPEKNYITELDGFNKVLEFLRTSLDFMLQNKKDERIATERDAEINLKIINQFDLQIKDNLKKFVKI